MPFSEYTVDTEKSSASDVSGASDTRGGLFSKLGQKLGQDEKVSASDIQGSITRQQVKLFDSHFRPMEKEIQDVVGDRGYADRMARQSRGAIGDRFGSELTQGQAGRQASRYGVELNDRELARGDRVQGLSAAQAGAKASNQTRADAATHQRQLGHDMGRIGASLSERASQNASEAANMQRQREHAEEQMATDAAGRATGLFGLDIGIGGIRF